MKEWAIVALLLIGLLLAWEYFLGSKAPPTNVVVYREGGSIIVEWDGGFGLAKAYEVHVVGEEDKVYELVEGNRAKLHLPPGEYEIYIRAIRPSGPSLPSERARVVVEGTPPKIYGIRCENLSIMVEGEDIEECTFSKDGAVWAPLIGYGHPMVVEKEGTYFVECLNRYGSTKAVVLCK